ncbi:hypothetical protein D3C85_292990 [compost metagenome]
MSYVNNLLKVDRYKDIVKLLKNPCEWILEDAGTGIESFKHKGTGWYFYTDCNIICFRNSYGKETTASMWEFFVNVMTFRESRFVKRWIKETYK